jgi:flagellar motor component MotA
VYLKDSSYSAEGADALIASLQGVMLYYELAEPIVTEIEEPCDLTYEA